MKPPTFKDWFCWVFKIGWECRGYYTWGVHTTWTVWRHKKTGQEFHVGATE